MSREGETAFPQIGIGAVVFKDNKILLVKRSNAPSMGLWAIPGGRLELGETLHHAAEREILEETGIVIHAKKPLFTFDVIERDASGNIRYHYVIVDLEAEYVSGEPIASDDASEARWIAAEEIPSLPMSDKTLELLKDELHFI